MNATKLLTALMAMLVVSAGAGAATAASIDADTTTVDASYDDGTMTVTVTENATGVENVSVAANGISVGTTDANGSLAFDTNASEIDLELTKDGETIERTYAVENGSLVDDDETETDDENETADEESQLDATVSYDNGTVDVLVTQNGSAVENVSVEANGENVGMTDANGSLTFETNASEELELEFENGEMELEQRYTIEDGSLVMAEDDDEEEDAEGNVTLSANENASDRAHGVLAVVQQFLNSGGEGSLGQQIQDALGNDRGNSDNAPGNADKADKGKQKGNNGNGNADADADESDADEQAEKKGNADKGKQKGNNGNGQGNGNADADADDDGDEEADEEDDEEDDDDETESEE